MSSSSPKKITSLSRPVIVGAGPSGLAVAACLHQFGIPSIVLEHHYCIASLWKLKTYDRLKLHLPKHICQLPHLSFPNDSPKYPSKADFISYLESYAKHFSIQPKFRQSVLKAEFDPVENGGLGVWRVETQDSLYNAPWLIVASGQNAEPSIPEIPGIERFRAGPLMHSSEYRCGLGFEGKRVLVVGSGNSGMDVSLDLSQHNARSYMVVRNSVHILPLEIFGVSIFTVAIVLSKWLPVKLVDVFIILLANIILGKTEKFGIRRPKTGPLQLKNETGIRPAVDVGAFAEIKSGKIKVMKGVKEITESGAIFVDGQEEDFEAIIFATGYRRNVSTWLKGSDLFTDDEEVGMWKMPIANGWKGDKGLYTVGFSGRGLWGTSSNAIKIARDIAHQWKIC